MCFNWQVGTSKQKIERKIVSRINEQVCRSELEVSIQRSVESFAVAEL
jgi:hypothetical protein